MSDERTESGLIVPGGAVAIVQPSLQVPVEDAYEHALRELEETRATLRSTLAIAQKLTRENEALRTRIEQLTGQPAAAHPELSRKQRRELQRRVAKP